MSQNSPTSAPPSVTVYFKGAKRMPAVGLQFQGLIGSVPGVGESRELKPSEDLVLMLKSVPQAIVVMCVSDKEELVEASGILGMLKPKARPGALRVLVFNAIEINKVHTHLVAQGACDVLPFTLSRPAFIKKLHYNVVLLENARKQKGGPRAIGGAKDAQGAQDAGPGKEAQIAWVPPITTLSDCWLVRKTHIKSVLGNWFIELTGPGPAAGAWKSADPDSTEEERMWEWAPRPGSSEALLRDPGKWQLVAKQPEFLWKVNRYKIIGKRAELRWMGDGGRIQWRFRTLDSGALEIAENSECAKGKIALIETTFESSIVIKTEKEKKQAGQDFVMTDTESGSEWGKGDLSADAEKDGPELRDRKEREKAGADFRESREKEKDGPAFRDSKEKEKDAADFRDSKERAKDGPELSAERAREEGRELSGELGEDAPAKDWNGTDIRREKAASGSGIGLGQGGKKGYGYEDPAYSGSKPLGGPQPEFATGADAFASIQLKFVIYPGMDPTKPGHPAELLEQEGNSFVIDAPVASCKVGERILCEVISIAEKTTSSRIEIQVDSEEPVDELRKIVCGTLVSGNAKSVKAMVSTFAERQAQILKFIEEARGY